MLAGIVSLAAASLFRPALTRALTFRTLAANEVAIPCQFAKQNSTRKGKLQKSPMFFLALNLACCENLPKSTSYKFKMSASVIRE